MKLRTESVLHKGGIFIVRLTQKGALSCWVFWHTERSVSKDSIIAVISDPHKAKSGGLNNEVLNSAPDSSEDEPLEVNTHDQPHYRP